MKKKLWLTLGAILFLTALVITIVFLFDKGFFTQKENFLPTPKTLQSELLGENGDFLSAENVAFSAQYIRTGVQNYEGLFPAVTVIRSAEELRVYHEENKDQFDLERRERPASDFTIGFLDACDKYNDAFFEKNALVLVVLEEGSGSTRHNVEWVKVDGSGTLYINILSIDPQVGTCDMAWWHIITEIPQDKSPQSEENVKVHYNNERMDREHLHQPAGEAKIVDDPITGYCGNTMTTVHFSNGRKYSFMFGNSVSLTDLLVNLKYDPEKVCKCLPEYTVDTEFELGYEISLTQSFVRSTSGQADLTLEQIETLKNIFSRVEKEAEGIK